MTVKAEDFSTLESKKRYFNRKFRNKDCIYTAEIVEKDRDGIEFFKNILKYPIGLGFVGKAIEMKRPLVYYRPDELEPTVINQSSISPEEYTPEVDNVVGQSNLKNALYGSLFDNQESLQGALQLLNKSNGDGVFSEEEIEEFNSL